VKPVHRAHRSPLTGLLVALAWPCAAAALEPRFDHRDLEGPLVEVGAYHDSVVVGANPTAVSVRAALRVAWSYEVSGEGDELVGGVTGKVGGWSDPGGTQVLCALDLRYRAYFGSEQLKTWVEAGLWVPIVSRLAIGPSAGLGFAYDFDRKWGLYVGGNFSTAFGQARITTFGGMLGGQLRF
jgi:hypothetical protein